MFLYFKVILDVSHDEMNKMQRTNDANIVQYVFEDLADDIVTLL